MTSSGLAHLSDTSVLRIVRAVVTSPFALKMYSLDFIGKPTNVRDSILSLGLRSICQRPHSIPHSFPEHASAHVVSATSPSFERSRFSNVAACPVIQAMVFDSGGVCIWQLNSSSFLSVLSNCHPPVQLLSRPIHFQRDHREHG